MTNVGSPVGLRREEPEHGRRLLFKQSSRIMRLILALAAFVSASEVVAQDVVPPKAYTTTPGGINASDGNFVYEKTDLSLGSLALERFHRGGQRQPNNPMFGTNFSSNFDIYVARNSPISGTTQYVIVHIGNSASGQYWQRKSAPTSIGPDNDDAKKGLLSWNGSRYSYTDSRGTIYTFSATVAASGLPSGLMHGQRVAQIDFPNGRRQTFIYTAAGQPKFIEDSSGYAIVFDYNGINDVSAACILNRSETYVSTATTCAGAVLKTTYAYTSGRLTSVVDVMGGVTDYVNSSAGVTCITPPSFLSCKYSQSGGPTYNTPSFGNTQILADGGTWQVTGQDWGIVPRGDEGSPAPYDGHVEVAIVDPNNKIIGLTFTKSSPYAMTDQLGRSTTFRFFGGETLSNAVNWGAHSYGSMLVEATYPEGDKYLAEYNGPFKSITKETHVAKPASGLPDLVKTYTYGPCTSPGSYKTCGKPASITDPGGNTTNWTYAAAHGGVLSEMKPAPTSGAARPLTVYTYVQKYAYIKNSGGSLVAASSPVWLPATMTECQAAAGSSTPVCDSGAPQRLTTYQYGANGTANNLLVHGIAVSADGVTLRTCYGYDALGRRISETKPNANLSTCP